MTIDEAIKCLTYVGQSAYDEGDMAIYYAAKLGIEALKRIKFNRLYPSPINYQPLPGETKE